MPTSAKNVVGRRAASTLVAVAMAGAGLVALAPAAAAEVITRPGDGVLQVQGHGYGHGRGMSQWGAYGAATKGLSHDKILSFYYPGTTPGTLNNSSITVRITSDTDGSTDVQAQPGLSASAGGTTALLPTDIGATRWRTRTTASGASSLQYLSTDGDTSFWTTSDALGDGAALAGPVTFSNSSGRVRLLLPAGYYREYAGSVKGARYGSTHYSVVTTTMETYLRGVVPNEMPASWPAEALKAQAVAARTYAANQRASAPSSRPYQTCDSTACQVFDGLADYTTAGNLRTTQTDGRSDAAISATGESILTYPKNGTAQPAFTEFSASNGGYSVTGDFPYLVAKKDPYDGAVPNSAHYWTDVIYASTIEKANPSIGRFVSMSVHRDGHGDWGGRPTSVVLTGSAGTVTVSGSTFSSSVKLKHRWWALRTPQTVPPAPRIAGGDRYETAAAVATSTFSGPAVAYVASGAGFPDALAGAALAGSTNGPVLLTAPRSLPSSTATALRTLKPGRIVVLGGRGAVSDAVLASLRGYTAGGVTRLAGDDRYGTAAEVAKALGGGAGRTVYLASGTSFPDALAGAALAGAQDAPVLLTGATTLPDATAAALTVLQPTNVVVLGGAGAVSEAVMDAVQAQVPTAVLSRVAGTDRYATAAQVAALFPAGVTGVYVASGLTYPDALAGAAAAGFRGFPVLLTKSGSLPPSTAASLQRIEPSAMWLLGGKGAVSDSVAKQLGVYISR